MSAEQILEKHCIIISAETKCLNASINFEVEIRFLSLIGTF